MIVQTNLSLCTGCGHAQESGVHNARGAASGEPGAGDSPSDPAEAAVHEADDEQVQQKDGRQIEEVGGTD